MKKHIFPIILILLFGSWLIGAIFQPGWYTSHDGVYHILRTEEALKLLKLGHFPIRWAGTLDQGFGIPLFNFIYPLPYYLSAIFSLVVSPAWSVKIITVMSYLFGGLGMYALFSNKSRYLGVVLALIYLMTPYQFLNIFVRGALGEILAMGLIPWVLYIFTQKISATSGLKWYYPIPLALLLISHNFLGILFIVFLIGYILVQKEHKKTLFSSLLISVGMASFFLLPMILERGYLQPFDVKTTSFRFDHHFVYLRQFLYSKWDYWYSVVGPEDGMSYQLGFAQMALSALGIAAIIFTKKRTLTSIYLSIAYLGSIFLMTSRSFFIWDNIKILQTIQFPWRLLFMTATLTPFLGFNFLQKIKSQKLLVFITLVILSLGFWNVRNYRRPMKVLSSTEYTDLYLLNVGKTTTTQRNEILPKWSTLNERFKSDEILVNSGNMLIEDLSTTPLSIDITINNKPDPIDSKITILRNYYPSWVATMDGGKKVSLTPTPDGMIYLIPEYGTHTYKIEVKSTPLEIFANLLSLGSALSLIYIWRKNINQ